jgi:hypothetical protein
MKKRWTQEEEEYLFNNYPIKERSDLAKILHRTNKSITRKIEEMNPNI